MDIANSKNVVIGGFRNVEGNIHIGDIYQYGEIPPENIDYYEGLPDISADILLPQEPYIGLRWFGRDEARIFFGRGRQIQQIYKLLTNPLSDRFIFLYGQSGVGKSSLLEAGVIPRIESVYQVWYFRRDTEEPVWKCLKEKMSSGIANGNKILLIVDQFEGVFTQPNASYQDEAVETFSLLIEWTREYPDMKFILGFRKEYLPEIELLATNLRLSFTKIFIEPLNELEISEAVYSVCSNKAINAKYHLKIDKELRTIIAKDLSRDDSSHIAPALQILMTKLWQSAKVINPDGPEITKDLYEEYVVNTGILLSGFINEQISTIKKDNAGWVTSGLVYDLLELFVTEHYTAASWRAQDVIDLYGHLSYVHKILAALKDLYLITEDINVSNQDNRLRLAHDSLGPLVKKIYNNSLYLGQKARIILENRIKKATQNEDGTPSYPPLDETDLNIVLGGKQGMRKWTEQEQQLVDLSGEVKFQRKRKNWILTGTALFGSLFIMILVFVLFDQKKLNAGEKNNNRAMAIAAKVTELYKDNPTQAIRLLEEASKLSPNNETVLKHLYSIYANLSKYPAYYKEFEPSFQSTDFMLSPNALFFAEYDESSIGRKIAAVKDMAGTRLGSIQYKGYEITQVIFFKSSSKIATLFSRDQEEEDKSDTAGYVILITDFSGKILDRISFNTEVSNFTISSDEKILLTGEYDNDEAFRIVIRSLNDHRQINQIVLKNEYMNYDGGFSWHPDGKHVVFCTDNNVRVLNTSNGNMTAKKYANGHNPFFSPSGSYFAVLPSRRSGENKQAMVWHVLGKMITTFPDKENIQSLNFSKDEKLLVTSSSSEISKDNYIKIWKVTGEPVRTINTASGAREAVFFKSSDKILLVSDDNAATILDIEGEILMKFEDGLLVNKVGLFDNESRLMTATSDGIKLWNLNSSLPEFSAGHWQIYNDTQYFHIKADSLFITDTHQRVVFRHRFPMNILATYTYGDAYWIVTGVKYDRRIVEEDQLYTSTFYYFKKNVLQNEFTKTGYSVTSLDVDTLTNRLLAVCSDRKARLLDEKGDSIVTFSVPIPYFKGLDKICTAYFSPDMKQILMTTMIGYKLLYDDKGKLQKKLDIGIGEDRLPTKHSWIGRTQSACFSPDGSKLGIYPASGALFLYDIKNEHIDSILINRNADFYSGFVGGQFITDNILLARSKKGISIHDINTKEVIASLNGLGNAYYHLGRKKNYMFVNSGSKKSLLLALPSGVLDWLTTADIAPLRTSLKNQFKLN